MILIIGIAVLITSIVDDSQTTVHSTSKPSFYVPSFSVMPSDEPTISSAPSNSPAYTALKDFFYSTSGDYWLEKSHWLNSTKSWCVWYGLTCGENSESIEKIQLSSNNSSL